jgi:hypothetical protein
MIGHSSRWVRRRLRQVMDGGDRGTLALFIPVITVGLLAMAGLVVDGGAAINARERAADVSQQAARAGADALAPNSLRGPSPQSLVAYAPAAKAAAQHYLAVAGITGTVSVTGDVVTVTATVRHMTAILSALGMTTVTGTATSTATAVHGNGAGGN